MNLNNKTFLNWKPERTFAIRQIPKFIWRILKSKYLWLGILALIVLYYLILIAVKVIDSIARDMSIGKFLSNYWLIIVGTLSIILTFLVIWLIPKWQVRTLKNKKGSADQSEFDLEKERIKLRDDTRKTMAQIIGGTFFVLGLFVTYNTFELNRQGQELSREGQVTDRFSKAVELIGSENLSDRLGGLYALERIAKDSPKDHSTVMEILTAYIRERSRMQREKFDKDKIADANKNQSVKIIQEEQLSNNSTLDKSS